MERWKFAKSDGGWWLVIDSIEKLLAYKEKTDIRFGRYLVDLDNKLDKSEKFNYIAKLIAEKNSSSLADGMLNLSNRIFKGQLDVLQGGKTIYINESGGYNSWINPIKIAFMKNLTYPNYTEENIKITQWGGDAKGSHYYAYIGDIEVRDGDTIKWNTYKEAYEQALQYIST